MDVYHLPLSIIARLTDKQLFDIYNHPRDKEGRIKEPEEKPGDAAPAALPSLERDLCQLAAVAGMIRMPAEKYAALKQQVEAKWAAKAKEEKISG